MAVATVIKHTGSHYLLSRLPEWKPFPAVIRGKLRLKEADSTNPIAVGDRVEYEFDGTDNAVILSVLPRNNCIIRKSVNLSRQAHVIAANLDMAFLVVTINSPKLQLPFVDRFLVTCQAYSVPVTIIVNKMDMYDPQELEEVDNVERIYVGAGYRVIKLSALAGVNVDVVKEMCKGKVVLFSGQSGVGKSSIIGAFGGSEKIKIGEISAAHNQGKHTTTFYEMHHLESGGFMIDSPGIRGFGLVNFEKEEVSSYFPEMLRVEDGCRYKPCTHTHEPGCAVKQAVEEGIISVERYNSYLGMLEEESKYR